MPHCLAQINCSKSDLGVETLNLDGSIVRKICLLSVTSPLLLQVIQKASLIGSVTILAFTLSNPIQAMDIGELVIVRINSASGAKERIGMILSKNGASTGVRVYERSPSGNVTTSIINVPSSQIRPLDTASANRIMSGRQPANTNVSTNARPAAPLPSTTKSEVKRQNPAQVAVGKTGNSKVERFQQIIREGATAGIRPKQVTFESFQIGSPYPWRFDRAFGYSPDGPFGRLGATVYPVKTTFVIRETYADAYQYVRTGRTYSCFISVNKDWICNITGRIPGREKDQIWQVSR